MTFDELRWVGMDDCDLPVLSVFKDLHPRVAGSFSSRLFVARIRLTFTAPVRLRFRHAPLRRFQAKKPTPPSWNRRNVIVPSDSRPPVTVATCPRGPAQPSFEPDASTDLDRNAIDVQPVALHA